MGGPPTNDLGNCVRGDVRKWSILGKCGHGRGCGRWVEGLESVDDFRRGLVKIMLEQGLGSLPHVIVANELVCAFDPSRQGIERHWR